MSCCRTLRLAVEHRHLECLSTLLDAGADIEERDHFGGTVLHSVAFYNYIPAFDILHQRGANLNASDFLGTKPIHVACSSGNIDIINELFEAGVAFNSKDSSDF